MDETAPRLAAAVEYDGTNYNGWQIQPHAPSVQQAVEAALSAVAASPVRVVCAGRTDTGVHALGQVVHFDPATSRTTRSWTLGANTLLDPDVRILWVARVPADFHARYGALERTYRYRIVNTPVAPALDRDRAWWVRDTLDVSRMARAAQALIGEHDFSAFRASACQSSTAVRVMREISIEREGDSIAIVVRANAFLHHMVRNIVGSLVRVGRHLEATGWMAETLELGDRKCAGMTAPACGLYFAGIAYPDRYELPSPCYSLNQ